jgi:anti-sigma regulatory factor (Ser/Thr protein kinase)
LHSGKSFPCNPTPHRRWPRRAPDGAAVARGHPIRLRFSGTLRGFERGFEQLRGALDGEAQKLGARARYHLELVFEEIVGNIVRYGAPQGGELRVEVSIEIGVDYIEIAVEDDGIPFDPCGCTDLGAPTSLAGAPDGGFGLRIVRHVASTMQYERSANQRNRLVVTLSTMAH